MKTMTELQLRKIRQHLSPHLAERTPAGAVDFPLHTLQSVLDPVVLATKAGMQALSNVLYRTRGLTITKAIA